MKFSVSLVFILKSPSLIMPRSVSLKFPKTMVLAKFIYGRGLHLHRRRVNEKAFFMIRFHLKSTATDFKAKKLPTISVDRRCLLKALLYEYNHM